MPKAGYPFGFYVYQLVDPRNGLPFYVGKGQGDRAWQHERQVKAGKPGGNARKVAKIENILRVGLSVGVEVVAEYDLESDALDHEYRLVDRLPTLTNVMPGGCAPVRGPMTPEQEARYERVLALRRLERVRKLAALREKERAEALKLRLERERAFLLQGAGAERYGAEITAWLERQSDGGRVMPDLIGNPPSRVRRRAEARALAQEQARHKAETQPQSLSPTEARQGGKRNRRRLRPKRSASASADSLA